MGRDELKQAVGSQMTARDTLTARDFEFSPGSNGQRTKVASLQANRPLALVNGAPVDMALMAYEEKTAAGGAPETFNLAHDLIKSGATAADVEVRVNGALTQPAAVDYDADTVDVDTAADDTVGIYYASGKQAQAVLQKTAPNGTKETLHPAIVNLLHHRDHDENPVTFDLTDSFWQSIIPTNWTLDLYVDAPYVTRFEKDGQAAANALLALPIVGGSKQIPGLGKRVRQDAAER